MALLLCTDLPVQLRQILSGSFVAGQICLCYQLVQMLLQLFPLIAEVLHLDLEVTIVLFIPHQLVMVLLDFL